MKTLDISNPKHLALLLALASTVSNQTISADVAEDFESYSDGQSLNAVNQWVGDATVSAITYPYNVASRGYPISGAAHTKVMNVAGVVENTAGSSDYSMVTWSDMIVKPGQFRQAPGHPDLQGNSPVGFYINSSGHPVVAHTEYGTGNTIWTEITDVTLSASDYHRVTVQMDYRSFDVVEHHRYYAILINGEYLRSASARADQTGAAAGGQWFPMIGDKAVAGIAVSAGSASLDDVVVGSATNYSAVSVSAPSVYEVANGQSSSHDFVIELDQASDLDVTINYTTQDGTATAGADYTAVSGQVVIPAGQTQAVVSVTVNGDAVDDSGEAFSLSLTRIQNAVVLDPQDTNVLIIDDSGDEDEDGLNNGQEIALGTDPLNYDSDGDSFSDYLENLDGSDPLDASSTPTNSQNLAPFFAALESGKQYGYTIPSDQHEFTEIYSGVGVTFRAFNSSDAPINLKSNTSGKFGAGGSTFKTGNYISITFDRDTYLDEIGFGSWAGSEFCQISGDAIAALNGIDDTAGNTFVHDPVAKTLQISGQPNPVALIDNVTGEGLLVPAGSEIRVTFLNGTASIGWLNFQPRISVSEAAAIGTLVQNMQSDDPNQNDVLTTEIIAGNDSGLFAVDNAGNVTVAGTLDYSTATEHTLTLAVTDLGGLVTQQDLKIFVTKFDSDNDGLEDAWEIANFGDLASQSGSSDADNDGLTNAEEYALNSDPNSSDSDSDGVDDALEVAYGTDPANGGSTPVIEAPVFAEIVAAFTTTGAVNGAADYIVTDQGITMTILPDSTLTDPDQIGYVSGTMGVVGSTGGSKSTQTVGDGETLRISFDADVFLRDFDAGNRGSGETTYLTSAAFDGLTGVVGTYDDATDSISAGGDILGMDDDGPGNGIFIPANTHVDFTVSAGGSISYKGITVASVNSATVAENVSTGTEIISVAATDAQVGEQLSYAITAGNDSDLFAIDSNGAITTTAALDFATASRHELTVSATDLSGLSASTVVILNVTDVNGAPVASDDLGNIAENGSNGDAVATVSASDADGDTLSFAITAGDESGAFVIDSNGNITATAALDYEAVAQYILTVEVSDGEFTDSATITVNVTDVNEAPSASDLANSLTEGSAGVVGTVGASDPEGDNLSYVITTGNASGIFAIDANGRVSASGALDFETASQHVLTVEVSDGEFTDSATVTVDVTNVNEAPVASGFAGGVNENLAGGQVIGTVSVSDADAGDSFSYAIVAGNAAGLFAIDSNGQITTTAALDFEIANAYALTVEVTDAAGLTDSANVTVTVGNVNEAPTASNASGSVAENGSAGAVIGTVATSDPEGDNLSYQIIGGNASGFFAIDANGQVTTTGALDYEAASQYVLTVQVSDGTLTDTAQVTVNVTDVNEAPTASNSSGSVAENGSAGAVVDTVATSDPEGDALSYQITAGNASGHFAIDSNGQVTTTGALDFEAASQHVLTVEVSDGALTDTATVTANVTDVNEAPSVANNSASIAEDVAVGTTVVSVSANDPDAGASLSYSITAGNTGNAFSIDSNGNVKVASALDYETTTSYNLTVQVSDGSLTDTAQVTVNVTEVVEVSVASIATGSASNISTDSADVGYSITDDGNEAPTVTIYYGESDGGQSAGAWSNSRAIGVQNTGSYVEQLTGLTEGTDYFYTVSATNSAGTAWGSTANFTTEADTTPKLVRTTVSGVSSSTWTTVDLGQNYNSAVIVATPVYPAGTTTPAVTRIRNVSGSSFELKLDRADGQTGELNLDVSVVAVEEGVYTLAEDGVKMEAVKFTSTVTGGRSGWVYENRAYQNSYTAPVVVGQVMSHNDANWSAFWSTGSSRTNPVDAENLNVGKHVGEDPNATRADETVGYIVIESGVGAINGVAYEAAIGADSVRGFDNSATPYTYSLSGSLATASAAALSVSGMDGQDGSWAVLSGSTPLTSSALQLHAVEDQMKDTEQSHTHTQVGYLIFE